jgi:hypothetical protein
MEALTGEENAVIKRGSQLVKEIKGNVASLATMRFTLIIARPRQIDASSRLWLKHSLGKPFE